MVRQWIERATRAPRAGLDVTEGLASSIQQLVIALPEVGHALPLVVRDLHRLVENLARMTSERGELTLLLREATSLLRSVAETQRDREPKPRSPIEADEPWSPPGV